MKKPPHKHSQRSQSPRPPKEHQPSSFKPATPPTPRPPTNPTHWANVADWYDALVGEDGSEFHREVILPGLLRMLQRDPPRLPDAPDALRKERKKTGPELPPLHILDLACGQGVVARRLASAGTTVLGLDAAAPLIEAARRRNEQDHLPLRYEVADATRLLKEDGTLMRPLEPDAFDAVTLVLAIQNITPLSPVWHACHAALKPGGSLIVVMMHPAFRIPRAADWLWEEKVDGGTQARIVRQYLSSTRVEIQTHPGLAAHGKRGGETTTPHFHRPLQAYVNTLGNAGLLIDHMEEWPSHKTSQPGPRKAALDKSRKEIPMFLALRARKVTIAP
jgi:2-polyprenyl-3-methyl-5-hydroxy-6-metoxy-1,4-benzoquinol methylase